MPAAAHTPLITSAYEELLKRLRSATDTVLLASPFLSAGIAKDLAKVSRLAPAQWTLLTSLNAGAMARDALSSDGLLALLDAGVSIRTIDRLHAKVYLADETYGIAGSANLTGAGLGLGGRANLEVSTRLTGDELTGARDLLRDWSSTATPVTRAMVLACQKQADTLQVVVPPAAASTEAPPADTINALLRHAENVQSWVKTVNRGLDDAIAWAEHPWVSSPKKGRPSFRTGDLLLINAKYAQLCHAVLEVDGPTRFDPAYARAHGMTAKDAARWPWITPTNCRLEVPVSHGVPLAVLGKLGSTHNGHCRLTRSEFTGGVLYMAGVAE